MKTIYMHIGSPKTGTTSLQSTIRKNEKELEKQGCYYFRDKSFLANHVFAWGLRNKLKLPVDAIRCDLTYEDIIKKYLSEIESTEAKLCLLSTEALFGTAYENPESVKIIRDTFKDYRVKIIAYLRRQDLFVESNFAQMVKDVPFTTYSIAHFAQDVLNKSSYNYYEHLQIWEKVFGKENIIVRPFERTQLLHGDILEDFFSALGLQIDLSKIKRNPTKNITPPAECIYFFNQLNTLPLQGKYRKELYQDIIHYLEKSGYLNNNPKKNLLSPSMKIALTDEFKNSNKLLSKVFHGKSKYFFSDQNANLSGDNYEMVTEVDVKIFMKSLPKDILADILSNIIQQVKALEFNLPSLSQMAKDIQYFHDKTYDLINNSHSIHQEINKMKHRLKKITDLIISNLKSRKKINT